MAASFLYSIDRHARRRPHGRPRREDRRLAAAKATHEKGVLAGMIDATDRQIDRLVYELYGLTEDEVAIVGRVV